MVGIRLASLLNVIDLIRLMLLLFGSTCGHGLIGQQFVRIMEQFSTFATSLIVILVEGSHDHIREVEVLRLVSLVKWNVLESLLVDNIGKNIVTRVTLHDVGFFLNTIDVNLWCLSSILGSQHFQGVLVDAADSVDCTGVDFGGVPDLLIISSHGLPVVSDWLLDVSASDVLLPLNLTAILANRFDAFTNGVNHKSFPHSQKAEDKKPMGLVETMSMIN